MASIIASGIGSGIDIASLVSDLVEAQRAPQEQRLALREANLQARLSGYGSIRGALAALQQSLNGLQAGTASGASSVEVGDSAVLSASAGSGITGSHRITVGALATSHRLVTDGAAASFASATDVLGTGALTFRFGTSSYDAGSGDYAFTRDENAAERTVTVTDGSLSGIAAAINEANIGVQASVLFDGASYRLALASTETGAARSMQIVAQDADGNDTDAAGLSLLSFSDGANRMLQTQAAADVEGLEIDGIAVTSTSNTLTGLIEGVEVRLRGPGASTLDISRNDDAFVDAIKEFVDRYNALINTIGNLSSYDAETGVAGQLNGDSLLRTVQTQVRDVMSRLIGSNDAGFRHLSQIGLTHGSEGAALDGTLVLDEARLREAIAEDHAGVAALFSAADEGEGAPPAGYAVGLNRVISGMLAGGGLFASVTESLNGRIGDIGRQREQLELRMAAFEERTRAKFNAMDILVAQLQSTGNFLTQQLDALPRIGARD